MAKHKPMTAGQERFDPGDHDCIASSHDGNWAVCPTDGDHRDGDVAEIGGWNVIYTMASKQIWHDGSFRGDQERCYLIDSDAGEFVVCVSQSGDDTLQDVDEFKNYLLEHKASQHPDRVLAALVELGELEDAEYLVIADQHYEGYPAKLIPLSTLEQIDYVQGQTDESTYYKNTATGDLYKKYSSRWQGSPDYEASEINDDDLPGSEYHRRGPAY